VIRISLAALWARKRRLVGTSLAVFLGVAFLAGTLVFSDTMENDFDSLFTEASAATDAAIRSEVQIEGEDGIAPPGTIDASVVDVARSVDGVAAAEPSIEGYGKIIGSDGEGLGGDGPPTFAGNWITDPDLNPYELEEGRAPEGPNEVVINRGAADDGDLHVGDVTTVEVPEPVEVTIVGIATFAGADGLGSSTFAAFTLEGAQEHLLDGADEVTSVVVQAEPGVDPDDLVARLADVAPAGTEVLSGSELVDEANDEIQQDFLGLMRTFLLVFAGIALLVATFSIVNTFSITVAQRARDGALLRALGATRAQILGSVVVEAIVVGVAASLAGLLGGVGIAAGLRALFQAIGGDLPSEGLAITPTTLVVAPLVGIVVTLVAGIGPAVRASRVSPLAALRDVALDRSGTSRMRIAAGALGVLGGLAVLGTSISVGGDGALPLAGLGAALLLAGVITSGPVVAGPVGAVLGAPLPRLRGVTGALARGNATRNPRRFAASASALMVGVAIVTMFTVMAASMKRSIDDGVSASVRGDLVISNGTFDGSGFSPELATEVGSLPEVTGTLGLGLGAAEVDGSSRDLTILDPAGLDAVLDLDVQDGTVAGMSDHGIAVSEERADDAGWEVGDVLPVLFADGTTTDVTVEGVYGASEVVGEYVVTDALWAPHATQTLDTTVLIALAEGVDVDAGKAAVEQVAAGFGDPDVLTRQGYIDDRAGSVDMMLTMVYVMLALAIVIALMGIANTLSLSIHERTRELGLLRAVGQTKAQVRSMIRWEAVLTALFGTVGGVLLGSVLGWVLVRAVSADQGFGSFALPTGQLVVVLVVGAMAGVLAALRPARRAARLPVLDAIATA
jgi:putative ABC transport system permease protein